MATRQVDYMPVAIEVGSNVEGQSSYAIDPIRLSGHQAGVAKSSVANKMWRQSSVMVSALANLLMEALDVDILDDGDVNALKVKLQDVLLGGRTTIMNSDTNFYISATGSDGPQADGLTQSTAFASPQHAFDLVQEKYDLNGFVSYFNIGSGQNFSRVRMNTELQGQAWAGGMIWRGAGMGASRINAVNTNAFEIINGADCQIFDIAVTATGDWAIWTGYGLWVGPACTVNFDRIDFQACSCHIHSTFSSNVYTMPFATHAYTISGGGDFHMLVDAGALLSLYGTNVTVTGNPHFSQAAIQASIGGHLGLDLSSQFVGAATGMRFIVDQLSTIGIGNRPETILPGDVSGYIVPDADSQYFNGIRV